MERVVEEEWLDADLGTQEEIDASLRTISRVNRLFGGNRLHTRLLRRALAACSYAGSYAGAQPSPPSQLSQHAQLSPEPQLSGIRVPSQYAPHILEVACGHAEVLQAALGRLRQRVQLTLLDRSRQHLPLPSAWPSNLPQPKLMVGDALQLPLQDASVDIVSCCLFVHHLDPLQVADFLAESLRVARVAVVINDLERTRTHNRLAEFFCRLNTSRISRHDGPTSVRAAYTAEEMQGMLAATGHRYVVERHFLYRLGAIVWKH